MCKKIVVMMFAIVILCSKTSWSFAVYDGSTPNMLKNFAEFHEKEYSQMLNSGKYSLDDVHVIEKFLEDMVSVCDFSLNVQLGSMDSIIESDEFKSAVQRFWKYFENAQKNEEYINRRFFSLEMFNADENKISGKDYEKYGYLSCSDKAQDLKDSLCNFGKFYGNVIINLKKENLLDRTTLFIGDSLNKRHQLGNKLSVIPTWAKDPKAICVPGRSAEFVEKLSNAIRNKDLIPSRPNLICHNKKLNMMIEYFELQFHGDLSFTRDVESVDIVKKIGCEDDEKKLKEKLEMLKIPYREYDEPLTSEDKTEDFIAPCMNQTFSVPSGKIIVKAPAGVFPEGSELLCRQLEKGEEDYEKIFAQVDRQVNTLAEKLKIFDIVMKDKYGNEIKSFSEAVTLYLEIPKGYNKNDIEIFHINEGVDESFDEWVETIDGTDYVVFNTKHFSPYAIVDRWGNADYWWMYGISLTVLAIGIGLTMYFRKKTKKSFSEVNNVFYKK